MYKLSYKQVYLLDIKKMSNGQQVNNSRIADFNILFYYKELITKYNLRYNTYNWVYTSKYRNKNIL